MTEVVDSEEFFEVTLVVAEGKAHIGELEYPSQVDLNQPVIIRYNCYNDGGADTIFGRLYDTTTTPHTEIEGGYWQEYMPNQSMKSVELNIGNITKDTSFKLVVGHLEE